jgi:hypothetical protein
MRFGSTALALLTLLGFAAASGLHERRASAQMTSSTSLGNTSGTSVSAGVVGSPLETQTSSLGASVATPVTTGGYENGVAAATSAATSSNLTSTTVPLGSSAIGGISSVNVAPVSTAPVAPLAAVQAPPIVSSPTPLTTPLQPTTGGGVGGGTATPATVTPPWEAQ